MSEVNCMNCIVTEFKDSLCEEEFCKKFKCARESKDFIEHVLEVAMPRGEWIPCSERLPEEDGRFLVFLPDRKGTFMCADFLSGKWYPDDYECTSNHVIAWMPLPEPYREEEMR